MSKLVEWLNSMEYLPPFMRDFHDQKDLFKAMHYLYEDNKKETLEGIPTWIDGHIYIIDWFLWYMARRGYTLQKSRKKLKFEEFKTLRELLVAQDETKGEL